MSLFYHVNCSFSASFGFLIIFLIFVAHSFFISLGYSLSFVTQTLTIHKVIYFSLILQSYIECFEFPSYPKACSVIVSLKIQLLGHCCWLHLFLRFSETRKKCVTHSRCSRNICQVYKQYTYNEETLLWLLASFPNSICFPSGLWWNPYVPPCVSALEGQCSVHTCIHALECAAESAPEADKWDLWCFCSSFYEWFESVGF